MPDSKIKLQTSKKKISKEDLHKKFLKSDSDDSDDEDDQLKSPNSNADSTSEHK